MTPDAYTWPTDQRIADLEAENDVLAACILNLLAGRIDTSRIRPDPTRGTSMKRPKPLKTTLYRGKG